MVETNDNADPIAKAKLDKKERQSKNELQRLRNIAKARNIKLPKVGLPTKDHFPNSQQLSEAVTIARTSTASVGKFQPMYVFLQIVCFTIYFLLFFSQTKYDIATGFQKRRMQRELLRKCLE